MSSQGEPEDQQADDQDGAGDDQEAAQAGSAENEQGDETPPTEDEQGDEKPPTEDERIEQITERIEKARTQAEESGVLVDHDEEEFVQSGATEEEDDQTIAPPG
jgi:hypothetical protein